MTRPNRHGTKPLPKRTKAILDASAERMKIRMLLSNGAIVTPIGPRTILRIPGSQMAQQFPTELVDAVLRDRMARAAGGEEAVAALEGSDDVG